MTPKALKKADDLVCRLCNPNLVKVDTEVTFIQKGQEKGFLDGMIWQYQPAAPRWWRGRIDFLHHPTKTLIQVDGSAHFGRYRDGQPGVQLKMDIAFNADAWGRGRGW